MRICIIYDCLYPHTVGGAEHWYRNLAKRLAQEGHDVTYLTLRQWEGPSPDFPGVAVHAVGPRMDLYVGSRRRVSPPLVFGLGVLWHLIRRGGRYDVVHTASFPYFSLLAAGALVPIHRYRLIVDWFEVWTRAYWREYLGRLGGRVGWWVQRLCFLLPQQAFCFSRLHANRLRDHRLRGRVQVLTGIHAGPLQGDGPWPAQLRVLFAGRHIPEKRVPSLIPALALLQDDLPGVGADILGDGPDRAVVERAVTKARLGELVSMPGFVEREAVDQLLRNALCLILPSRREGYGLIIVEASSHGTPSVVVRGPDNAAVELVDDGVNGVVAASAEPAALAEAVVRVHRAGEAMRQSTAEWFELNAPRLSLDGSLNAVLERYRDGALPGEGARAEATPPPPRARS